MQFPSDAKINSSDEREYLSVSMLFLRLSQRSIDFALL